MPLNAADLAAVKVDGSNLSQPRPIAVNSEAERINALDPDCGMA